MGGRLFECEPVPREVATVIISHLEEHLESVVNPLGSTLKKKYSGDIDVGVSSLDMSWESLELKLRNFKYTQEIIARPYMNIIFVMVSYNDKHYQMDVNYGLLEWMNFAIFSPMPKESKYKGVYRTELIASCVASKQVTYYHNDVLIARHGPLFNFHLGIKSIFKIRPLRKDKKGFIASEKSVPFKKYSDFIKKYDFTYESNSQFSSGIINSDIFCEVFFKGKYSPEELNTFENVLDTLHLFDKDLVLEIYRKKLESRNLKIPEEIL